MLRNVLGPVGGVTNCDCAIIGAIPLSKVTDAALVAGNMPYPYEATATNAASYFADRPVCVSGAQSATENGRDVECGIIANPNIGANLNGRTITTAVLTDVRTTLVGDSGAPWGAGRVYMGVHSGTSATGAVFSRSANLAQMNVTLIY